MTCEVPKGILDTYRKIYPHPVKSSGGISKGDTVRYKRSERTVERVWGKIAGKVVEIRTGPTGPTVISSRGVGKPPAIGHIGPVKAVAMMKTKGRKHCWSSAQIDDLSKVK